MSRWIVIDADVIPNIYTATHQELIFALEDSLGASTEIICCGECKKAEHEPSGVRCGLSDVLMGENGFCSIGKRNADSNTFNTLDALDSSEKPNNLSEIPTGSERSRR